MEELEIKGFSQINGNDLINVDGGGDPVTIAVAASIGIFCGYCIGYFIGFIVDKANEGGN